MSFIKNGEKCRYFDGKIPKRANGTKLRKGGVMIIKTRETRVMSKNVVINHLAMVDSKKTHIASAGKKGRGVFASQFIEQGEEIEVAPVIS